jgi:peptide/nickel transport system permease protein
MQKIAKYLFKKLLYGAAVLVAIVVLVTSIVYQAPVDPALMTFGETANSEAVAAKRKELMLDQPLYKQILHYLNDISPISYHKNDELVKYSYQTIIPLSNHTLILKWPYLRNSYQNGRPVTEIIADALPQTFFLALFAMAFASVIGLFLGIIAALNQSKWLDHLISGIAVLGVSLPSYVAAILLAYFFGVLWYEWTGLEHTGSLIDYSDTGEKIYRWQNLILPGIALGIRPIAIFTQLTRASMIEVMAKDYIRTARAKGLSEYVVVMRHALRNALNPVVTAMSSWFASLLAGAVFVEAVFNYKGLGTVMIDHLLLYDIPTVLGINLLIAFIFLLMNILVDLTYQWLDPTIKVE